MTSRAYSGPKAVNRELKAVASVLFALRCTLLAVVILLPSGYDTASHEFKLTTNLRVLSVSAQDVFDATVQDALERLVRGRSLRSAPSDDGYTITVTPRRTFRTGAGVFCRQFDVLLEHHDQKLAVDGVACRNDTGRWKPIQNGKSLANWQG